MVPDIVDKATDVISQLKNKDNTVDNAMKTGIVTTMFGRKRLIPELLSSNKMLQAAGKRIAMNTPVQGTAADLIKIAMINVYRRLKAENLNAELILQVHDELIFTVLPEEKEALQALVLEEMQSAAQLAIPLIADVGWGKNWLEAH